MVEELNDVLKEAGYREAENCLTCKHSRVWEDNILFCIRDEAWSEVERCCICNYYTNWARF